MIFSTDRQKTALGALKNMNWGLQLSMRLAAQVCSPRHPTSPFTIEFFLCGLYLRDQKRVLRYFKDEEPYKKMVEDLCGTFAERSTVRRGFAWLMRRDAVSLFVKFDEQFVDILCQAAELSSAGGRRKIELRDFMSAVASNQDVANKLFNDRGLKLRVSAN